VAVTIAAFACWPLTVLIVHETVLVAL